jgi:multidrug resistance efflux pump
VPFDGVVAVLDVEPGQTVLPGQVLVVVADLQH